MVPKFSAVNTSLDPTFTYALFCWITLKWLIKNISWFSHTHVPLGKPDTSFIQCSVTHEWYSSLLVAGPKNRVTLTHVLILNPSTKALPANHLSDLSTHPLGLISHSHPHTVLHGLSAPELTTLSRVSSYSKLNGFPKAHLMLGFSLKYLPAF